MFKDILDFPISVLRSFIINDPGNLIGIAYDAIGYLQESLITYLFHYIGGMKLSCLADSKIMPTHNSLWKCSFIIYLLVTEMILE